MGLFKSLDKVSTLFFRISEVVSAIFLAMVTAILFFQVCARVFLGTNFPWAEEIARLLMLWVAMLGGSILIKENDLISVDFLDPIMPKFMLKYREVVITLLLFWLCSVLAIEGWLQADYGRKVYLSSVEVSMFWPYFAIPVGAALMLFHYAVNTLGKFVAPTKGEIVR